MILLTGGSGLLGRYLKTEAYRPTHKQFDITKGGTWNTLIQECELIVHCAAYTKVQEAETEQMECFKTNVFGTLNLLNLFPNVPIIYISSEYAGRPTNFYSWTKRWAEELVQLQPNYLILRTLFKATPWPFEKAFKDQWTQGDYIDVIAPLIDKEIQNWSRKGKQLKYVGTGRKTMLELAQRTKPDVIPNSIQDMKVPIPKDYQ